MTTFQSQLETAKYEMDVARVDVASPLKLWQ